MKIEGQGFKSARLLDLVIRNYTFKSFKAHFKTGAIHRVNLPANLSGIKVATVRFRCGSLKRYGAQVRQFHLEIGVSIHPCVERVIIVCQNLGYNWSSIYYTNYDLSGYELVSPILGLLAYNAGTDVDLSDRFELGIQAGVKPITINFRNATRVTNEAGLAPLCVSFEGDGQVTLAKQASPYVCVAKRNGHFGLVIEKPIPVQLRKRVSKWKVVVGSSVGAALGAFLLGLLLVAIFVREKNKSRMIEMERRAYEEEALQVSMVGHIRAPTASGTRTMPTIEHGYLPPPSH